MYYMYYIYAQKKVQFIVYKAAVVNPSQTISLCVWTQTMCTRSRRALGARQPIRYSSRFPCALADAPDLKRNVIDHQMVIRRINMGILHNTIVRCGAHGKCCTVFYRRRRIKHMYRAHMLYCKVDLGSCTTAAVMAICQQCTMLLRFCASL